MWFGLAKMALQTGAKVYSNKQRTKMAMSDAAIAYMQNVWPEVRNLTRANF